MYVCMYECMYAMYLCAGFQAGSPLVGGGLCAGAPSADARHAVSTGGAPNRQPPGATRPAPSAGQRRARPGPPPRHRPAG